MATTRMMNRNRGSSMKVMIPNRVFFRIGDVAEILGVKPYVIRFWEGEFPFVAPDKASSGQRVYRRSQIESLVLVKHLLHVERYSIEGAKKKLTELRKQAKLKEAMVALVSSEDHSEVTIGSMVSKGETAIDQTPHASGTPEQISALEQKIADLQKLIREPNVQGMDVPGLKAIQ
jgi:DNA-binding transcriptional MerR regulator